MAPAGSRLGQLERPPGGVAGIGQPAADGLDLGQQVERPGGLGRPAGPGQGVGPAAEGRLVARRQAERAAVGLERLVEPAQPDEDAGPAR